MNFKKKALNSAACSAVHGAEIASSIGTTSSRGETLFLISVNYECVQFSMIEFQLYFLFVRLLLLIVVVERKTV